MRLYEFEQSQTAADILGFIMTNCQPYLSENKSFLPLYHGSSKFSSKKTHIITSPTNRKPKDSSRRLHEYMNNILDRAGVKANRTNASFFSGDINTAVAYGRIFVVFPIGEFDYSWSNVINDPYVNFVMGDKQKLSFQKRNFATNTKTKEIVMNPTFFIGKEKKDWVLNPELTEYLVKSYKDNNLVGAIKSGNEIMMSGKFLLVPENMWDDIREMI